MLITLFINAELTSILNFIKGPRKLKSFYEIFNKAGEKFTIFQQLVS